METLAELPLTGDQVVCLSHEPGPPATERDPESVRTPGDVGDDRTWCKRRIDNRPLLLLTPRPASLGPGYDFHAGHRDVLCTDASTSACTRADIRPQPVSQRQAAFRGGLRPKRASRR